MKTATEKRKHDFTIRLLAWVQIREQFGGWSKAAKHFKMKRHELIRACLDDLESVWGEKLDWKEGLNLK